MTSPQSNPLDDGPGGLTTRAVLIQGIALLYVAAVAWAMRDVFLDDAYIGFRYVDNLLSGQGLVFNDGERVEGVTNTGWLLALAVPGAALPLPVAAKILAVLLVGATVLMCSALAARLFGTGDALLVLPIPLLIVTHFDFLFFSLAGMETPLVAAGLCWAAWREARGRGAVGTAVICALLVGVRPECAVFYPLLLVLGGGLRRATRRPHCLGLLCFVMVVGLITASRYVYYGDVVPNTVTAKTSMAGMTGGRLFDLLRGRNVNVSAPFDGVVVVPFMLAGLLAAWGRNRAGAACLLASALVGTAFGVYADVDWTGQGRYFAPYVPLALVLFWFGFASVTRQVLGAVMPARLTARILVALAGAFAAPGAFLLIAHLLPRMEGQYPVYVMTGRPLVGPSRWMREQLPEDAVIATRRIGALAYFSDRPVFDYKFGLTDRRVARLVRRHGRLFDRPNDEALRELWQAVRPGYLLEDTRTLNKLLQETAGTAERFELHGIPYRVMRRFPLGEDVDWVLCRRLDLSDGG